MLLQLRHDIPPPGRNFSCLDKAVDKKKQFDVPKEIQQIGIALCVPDVEPVDGSQPECSMASQSGRCEEHH
jgi:hypothetical protein